MGEVIKPSFDNKEKRRRGVLREPGSPESPISNDVVQLDDHREYAEHEQHIRELRAFFDKSPQGDHLPRFIRIVHNALISNEGAIRTVAKSLAAGLNDETLVYMIEQIYAAGPTQWEMHAHQFRALDAELSRRKKDRPPRKQLSE